MKKTKYSDSHSEETKPSFPTYSIDYHNFDDSAGQEFALRLVLLGFAYICYATIGILPWP